MGEHSMLICFKDIDLWQCTTPGAFGPRIGTINVHVRGIGSTISSPPIDVFRFMELDLEILGKIFSKRKTDESEPKSDSPYERLRDHCILTNDYEAWFRLARLTGKSLSILMNSKRMPSDAHGIITVHPTLQYAFNAEHASRLKRSGLLTTVTSFVEIAIAKIRDEEASQQRGEDHAND